eukprot:1990813-Karenia_brevis.AAC.1
MVLNGQRYSLRGVVQHEGVVACAGHYTCFVRSPDKSWLFCNDFIPPVEVPFERVRQTQAYMLVYEVQIRTS